jgi:hypothetical protein
LAEKVFIENFLSITRPWVPTGFTLKKDAPVDTLTALFWFDSEPEIIGKSGFCVKRGLG